MKTKFEREEFFDLCWTKSISWFCKHYILTYQKFKSICTQNQIPLPPNGYWMKRKFGKEIKIPKLPPSDNFAKIELLIRSQENLENLRAIDKLHKIKDDQLSLILKVPERLPKNPDPIILEMLSDKPKTHPIVNNCRDYTKRYTYGRIWVDASKKPYYRALCFLDTFIKVMKARGHYFLFCYERSYIVIEGIEIAFRMREKSKRVYETEKSGYRRSSLEPIGILCFLAGEFTEKEWTETTNKNLAEKLPIIINYLEENAKRERKWRVENEKRKKEQAIERKKQERRERLQKEEIDKLRFIKQQSDLWHEAKKLREFLDACDKNNDLTEEMKELVSFGYKKVNWLDPLVPNNDEIFEDLNPYKIFRNL